MPGCDIFPTLRWRHNGRNGVSNHQPHNCLLNRLFRCRSTKTSKLRVTGLCAGNSPGTGEFPAQMASNSKNIFICWRHHEVFNSQTFDIVGRLYTSPWSFHYGYLSTWPSYIQRALHWYTLDKNIVTKIWCIGISRFSVHLCISCKWLLQPLEVPHGTSIHFHYADTCDGMGYFSPLAQCYNGKG